MSTVSYWHYMSSLVPDGPVLMQVPGDSDEKTSLGREAFQKGIILIADDRERQGLRFLRLFQLIWKNMASEALSSHDYVRCYLAGWLVDHVRKKALMEDAYQVLMRKCMVFCRTHRSQDLDNVVEDLGVFNRSRSKEEIVVETMVEYDAPDTSPDKYPYEYVADLLVEGARQKLIMG